MAATALWCSRTTDENPGWPRYRCEMLVKLNVKRASSRCPPSLWLPSSGHPRPVRRRATDRFDGLYPAHTPQPWSPPHWWHCCPRQKAGAGQNDARDSADKNTPQFHHRVVTLNHRARFDESEMSGLETGYDRLSALSTARIDASSMFVSTPAPQRVLPLASLIWI